MDDQDHDSFFSSIKLKNIDNQIPIAFNQVIPSKTTTLTTKSPPPPPPPPPPPHSNIIEKDIYKDKKYN